MDLTVRTGLSRADFITLISGVKADTSGFFEENAGTIYDLCEEYSLNELEYKRVSNGNFLWIKKEEKELLLTYQDQEVAIYEKKDELYKPKIMLI